MITEDTVVGNDDEDGVVFTVFSGRLLTADSGDQQPLCRFFGGPEFVWGPERNMVKNKINKIIQIKKKNKTVQYIYVYMYMYVRVCIIFAA